MTQHIEDKLAAMFDTSGDHAWYDFKQDMERCTPALLAVVRAARALNGAHDPSHRVVASMQLASALTALDAVEV